MAAAIAFRDSNRETRLFASRTLIGAGAAACLLLVLLARYFTLQVIAYDAYRTESDRNRVQLQPIPPRRGLIFDRNGEVLAGNSPNYVLTVVVERVPNLDDTLVILRNLLSLSGEELRKFRQRAARRRPYDAVPLSFRPSEQDRALLAVNRYRLPGVAVEAQLVRHYPQAELFSHALGYIGRINEAEQAEIDVARYRGTNHIGKSGVEKRYEDILLGQVGYQNVETNAQGRILRVLERTDPVPGADLHLSLDSGAQRIAYDALKGRRGAVVAMDPRSGEVLALVSAPGFDTNLFVNGISTGEYGKLRDSPHLPLFNRAVQGQYPPGSTMKPVYGLAGLEYGIVDAAHAIDDPGWYQIPGEDRQFRDWTLKARGGGHGPAVNLRQAIAESCDVYFYDLAYRTGIDRLAAYSAAFGLGRATGLDTTSEQSGVLPTREWKRRNRREPWYPGETLNVGIGQGYLLATPMQLAVMTSMLATRGEYQRPRLLRAVNNELVGGAGDSVSDGSGASESGKRGDSGQSGADDANGGDAAALASVTAKPGHWSLILRSMRDVFHGRKGTARGTGYGSLVKMGGKSGTSQVVSIAEDAEYDAEELEEAHRDHSLFIAFAPYDDPAIAVAVIVENGGNGSAVAAPIARRVIEQFLKGPGRFAAQQTQSPGSGLGNEGRSEDGLSSGLQGGNRQGRGSG